MNRLAATAAVCLILAQFAGCTQDEEVQGPAPGGRGYCVDTCPKTCGGDSDCDTANGQLCCDYGKFGSACVPAAQCPRTCGKDENCDTASGEACMRASVFADDTICMDPKKAPVFCSADDACDTAGGEVCCKAYKNPVCMPAGRCPGQCGKSEDCKTNSGQVCCTTMHLQDQALKEGGICIYPDRKKCPAACESSRDCDTENGKLCCAGLCRSSCPKECDRSSQCPGQICCKAAALISPLFYGQVGTPSGYSTLACESDSHCAASGHRRCHPTKGCVMCTQNHDCGFEMACDTKTNRCGKTCSSIMECMERECRYGCDPNKVCGLLQCAPAVGVVQCLATKCPQCFGSGFDDTGCRECRRTAYCWTASCSESDVCVLEELPTSQSAQPDENGSSKSSSSACKAACDKMEACGLDLTFNDVGFCSTSCTPEAAKTLGCIARQSCSAIKDGSAIRDCLQP